MKRNMKPKACDHDEPSDSEPIDICDEPDMRHVVVRELEEGKAGKVKFTGPLTKASPLAKWTGCRVVLCDNVDEMRAELKQ